MISFSLKVGVTCTYNAIIMPISLESNIYTMFLVVFATIIYFPYAKDYVTKNIVKCVLKKYDQAKLLKIKQKSEFHQAKANLRVGRTALMTFLAMSGAIAHSCWVGAYKNLNNFKQEQGMGTGLVPFYKQSLKWLKFSTLGCNRTWQGTVSETLAKVHGAWCTPTYSAMY